MHEQVVATGHHEDRDHLGQSADVGLQVLDHLAAHRPHLQMQKRLYVPVERTQADLRVIAGDHPAVAQQPHAFEARRRRDADRAGQVAVGLPSVRLQFAHDRRINFVHAPPFRDCAVTNSARRPMIRPPV
jgi:hypothetical protein